MDHSYRLYVHHPVEEPALGEILEFSAVAADARRSSCLVYDQRLVQVRRQSLAHLLLQEIGAVGLCCAYVAGGHLALRRNRYRRIRLGYPFGHVGGANPCFGREPLRQLVLVYLHPNMLWTEEMILAESHLLGWSAYILCLQDRGNQQRNQVPARPTDLLGDQIPGPI